MRLKESDIVNLLLGAMVVMSRKRRKEVDSGVCVIGRIGDGEVKNWERKVFCDGRRTLEEGEKVGN